MSHLDFNSADQQRSFELIPANTVCPVVMAIKPGGFGDGEWLTASKNSDAMMLNCEFTVTDGPYTKRKIFQYMVISGGKVNEKGESIAGNISRATLRAILESARNVKPDDMSEAAVSKRRIAEWGDFNGLCFVVKVGVEKGSAGYADKNKIMTVITPDMKEYSPVPQGISPATPSPQTGAAAPSAAPAWGTPPPPASNSSPVPAWAQ